MKTRRVVIALLSMYTLSSRHAPIQGYLNLRTPERFQVMDITRKVERIIQESGVGNGICVVHTPYATAAVILNEYESRLIKESQQAEGLPRRPMLSTCITG